MADGNITASAADAEMDLKNDLQTKIDDLAAMTLMVSGGGYAAFQECGDPYKQQYLWAMQRLAAEASDLCMRLFDLQHKGVDHG